MTTIPLLPNLDNGDIYSKYYNTETYYDYINSYSNLFKETIQEIATKLFKAGYIVGPSLDIYNELPLRQKNIHDVCQVKPSINPTIQVPTTNKIKKRSSPTKFTTKKTPTVTHASPTATKIPYKNEKNIPTNSNTNTNTKNKKKPSTSTFMLNFMNYFNNIISNWFQIQNLELEVDRVLFF